jgi:hypothetical protein
MSKETKIKKTPTYVRKTITQKTKDFIINRQYNRCANSPFNPALNLSDYMCPFWIYNDGKFDNSGYAIDHINEVSITSNNELENLQALCHNCHAVKTRKFKINKTVFTSTQLHQGAGFMEVDEPLKKKRKME